jgi:hypothetical protein
MHRGSFFVFLVLIKSEILAGVYESAGINISRTEGIYSYIGRC